MSDATSKTDDARMKVLGTAVAANAVVQGAQAAQNSNSQHSISSSSSAAIGVAATYGSNGLAFGITANASGTLTQSELQNHSNYEASSWGIGMSAGKNESGTAQTAQSDSVQVASFTGGMSGTSAGFSSKDGSSQSTTYSGISGNANGTGIAITDDLKQQSLTGKTAAETVASINKDITTGTGSGSLTKDWDAQQLKDQVNAGAQITAAFGQAAAERIGTYANDKVKELENTDPAEAAKWKEGGEYRVALHTATGALTGGLAGAAGAFTSATAMNTIGSAIDQMGLPKEVAQGLQQVSAGALGALVGGGAGLAAGVNVEANNRQLHPKETELIKDNAARFAKEMYGTDNPTPDQVAAATSLLANTAQNLTDNNLGYDVPYSKHAESFLHTLQSEYAAISPNLSIGNGQYLFYAAPEQKSSPYINSGTVDKGIADSIIKTPVGTPSNGNIFSANNPYNPINPCISAECIPQGRPGSGFDYVSFQGNVYVASGGFTVNLHDGTVYGSFGLSRNYPAYSIIPSVSLTAGSIIGGGSAKSTNDFLQGAGLWAGGYVPTPIPFVNAGGGINQGYGGRTASELGISTSPGAGVAPINYGFKPQKVSEK